MRQSFIAVWSKHRTSLTMLVAILLVCLLMLLSGISCPIKFLTGISCPGCGMTRACISAMRLDFAAAFAYHPLWVALPFAAFFLALFKIRNRNRAFHVFLYALVAVMLAVYLYRLLFTDSDVVVCSPKSGFVYRCVQHLIAFFYLK